MADESVVLERVQELTWAMLDEQITDDEMTLLENLLLSDDQARRHYLECIKLHADLMLRFASPEPETTATGTSKLPVLGFLNADGPPSGFDFRAAGDAKN